jgi:hypothetical protein
VTRDKEKWQQIRTHVTRDKEKWQQIGTHVTRDEEKWQIMAIYDDNYLNKKEPQYKNLCIISLCVLAAYPTVYFHEYSFTRL